MSTDKQKVKIMVGSTVYGFEDQLSQIIAQLNVLGFETLNSHYGSIKVNPNLSNLENCLTAVEECDLFLGIIRPYCGTGNIGDKNITFEEIKKAIELKKPYWFLVHRDVTFARNLFKKIKLKSGDEIELKDNKLVCRAVTFVCNLFKKNKRKSGYKIELEDNKLFDMLSIEIYEYVIKNHIPVTLRNGNWAQEFYRLDEMMVYINAQFSDNQFINEIINQTNSRNGK